MHLHKNKNIIVIFLISILSSLSIFSIDMNEDYSGFVIDSPLYANFESVDYIDDSYLDNPQSFSSQLGIIDIEEQFSDNNELAVLQAISDSTYTITPGDTFKVDYIEGEETKTFILQVDSEYKLNIPLIGVIDVKNKNISQVSDFIKNNISKYYAFSSPQVTFVSLGVFSINVIGEVTSSTRFLVNGLTHLSDVVSVASYNANTRDIVIRDINNNEKHYDLYLALKKGELDQNPLLKVGDTVILKKAEKVITLIGNVYKPGTYQIKKNEDLTNVLENYADGLLPKADRNALYISRYDNISNTYEEIDIDLSKDVELVNLDKIIIPSVKINKESVFVEGAISDGANNTGINAYSKLTMSHSKLIYNFYPKETLEEMLETVSLRFKSNSDLKHAYLIRDEEIINIDVLNYLTNEVDDDFYLKAGDRIVIPFDNKYVNVQGAVENGGTFVYEPNKKLEYYISLAGGLSQNATKTITIVDSKGNKVDLSSFIPSDSTIFVKEDTFKSDFAFIVSVVGLVSTTVGIIVDVAGLI